MLCKLFKTCYIENTLLYSFISMLFKLHRACLLNRTAPLSFALTPIVIGTAIFHQTLQFRKLQFFYQEMVIGLRIVKTSFYIAMVDPFSASKIQILFILSCTMSFFTLLASLVGIL